MKLVKLCGVLLVLFISMQVRILEASHAPYHEAPETKELTETKAKIKENPAMQANQQAQNGIAANAASSSRCSSCTSHIRNNKCYYVIGTVSLLALGGCITLCHFCPMDKACVNKVADEGACALLRHNNITATALQPNAIKPSAINFTRDPSEIVTAHLNTPRLNNGSVANNLRRRTNKHKQK